jgi:uncharacterized protein (TIGR02145 family)/uncharacterized repeat protein (TIGR02543 family)
MFKKRKWFLCKALFVVLITFTVALTQSDSVFADDLTSISVSAESLLELNVVPGSLETATLSFQVTTDNYYGYSVTLSTAGDSTDLVSDNNRHVPTISLPSGITAVPGSQLSNEYGYSLDGRLFKPVPSVSSQGDLVFDINTSSLDTPQTHAIEFGAKVDDTVSPGIYENTFLITVVANNPIFCDADTICYIRNGATINGTLEEQAASSNTSVMLYSPDYYKEGYGFAGWNTRADGHGTNYGPNETITTGDLSNNGLTLYARWIPSSGTMQNFRGCDAMAKGDMIALTDNRDGNVYTIAKQVDGACWMTDNLRLDFSNPDVMINAENTNNPTPQFASAVNAHPASSNQFCTQDRASCTDKVAYNNSYKIANGNYYNWYTATAGHGIYSANNSDNIVAGDICPVGWRLPTGVGLGGDLAVLDIAMGGTGDTTSTEEASNRWRKYPLNFTLSGQVNGSSVTDIRSSGNYHASNPRPTNARATNLWILSNKVSMNSNGALKHRGQNVRCMRRDKYTVHFEKNNEAEINGTMEDQAIFSSASTALSSNQFSHTYTDHLWYRFIGWNTKADGSGTSFEDGQKVVNIAGVDQTITLYAQWEEVRYADVTVLFDQDAVSRISLDNSIYGSQAVFFDEEVVPLAIGKTYNISFWENSGYRFEHWGAFMNAELGDEYDEITTLVISGDATLALGTNVGSVDHYHMQNINPSSCTETPILAYDLRDGEPYYIQRLPDGNCWMIDNMRLGSHALIRQISSANTNIASNMTFTMPSPTVAIDSYTTPQINVNNAEETVVSYGSSSGLAGTLYNFCAASAGTVCLEESPATPTYDLCPSGWSLPTGGTASDSEFNFLSDYFGAVADLRVGMSLTYSGWYDNATAHGITEYGTATYLWSKTPSNTTDKTYVMIVGRTKKTLNKGYSENNGMSMRCVLRE